MFRYLFRNYRRILLFCIGMTALSYAMLAISGLPLSIEDLGKLIAGSVGVFCLTSLFILLFSPTQRSTLEAAGLASLVAAAVVYFAPWQIWLATLSTQFELGTYVEMVQPYLSLIAGVVAFTIVFLFIAIFMKGPISRLIGRKRTFNAMHSSKVKFSADLVWHHIVPGVGAPDEHFTGLVASYTLDPEDPDSLVTTMLSRKETPAQYTVTFLENNAPEHCHFFFQGNESDGTLVDGTFEMHITETGDSSCYVTTREDRTGLPFGKFIERWFDDSMGFYHDRLHIFLKSLEKVRRKNAAREKRAAS